MTEPAVTLRPYSSADEDAAIALWQRTWQQHYPHIDFAKRVNWWRERWRQELAPTATIIRFSALSACFRRKMAS